MRITVVAGDLTEQRVEAIVNAANNRMRGGGGVDGAIHRAAGRGLLRECEDRFPRGLATGAAGWTTGHDLAARWVIHVVGPIYDGTGGNRDQLVSCYSRALEVADGLREEHGLEEFTIAFPLVSAGSYGWPKEDAIAAAVDTLAGARTGVTEARLVAFSPRIEALMLEAVARLT